MPGVPLALLIDGFAALGAFFALWKGGRAERAGALIVIVNVIVGQVSGAMAPPAVESTIRLLNDGLTALALLAVTVRYGALWMGAIMLFYAAQFAMHSFYLVTGRQPGDYLHALINNINFIGIVCCLIIGTAVAWRRRALASRRASAA